MKSSFAFVASLAGLVSFAAAEVGIYGQCGAGLDYKGDTLCIRGTTCTRINKVYSQCLPLLTTRDDNPIVGFAAVGTCAGGDGGSTVRVSTLAALKSAVAGDSKKIVILTASLKGNEVVYIGSNTSLLGANGVTLTGIGLRVLEVSNVIIRNLKISKVLASAGDAIGIQASSNVWVDHVDLSSDLNHGKDYYDGLLDITHGCTGVTVSWSHLHDHYKASLVGHSDDNGDEDKAITVTFHHNYFSNINSRTPSVRFGTVHIFNNYFTDTNLGIDTRDGAQLLIENNVFVNTKKPIYSTDDGYAVCKGNDFGGFNSKVSTGSLTSVPYDYPLSSTDSVKTDVCSGAGATLSF